jgi:hypothetical protein
MQRSGNSFGNSRQVDAAIAATTIDLQ